MNHQRRAGQSGHQELAFVFCSTNYDWVLISRYGKESPTHLPRYIIFWEEKIVMPKVKYLQNNKSPQRKNRWHSLVAGDSKLC